MLGGDGAGHSRYPVHPPVPTGTPTGTDHQGHIEAPRGDEYPSQIVKAQIFGEQGALAGELVGAGVGAARVRADERQVEFHGLVQRRVAETRAEEQADVLHAKRPSMGDLTGT